MTQTPLKFVSLGFGYVIQANNIWAVIKRKSAQSDRILRSAREDGRFLNCTCGREIKSIVLLDNGTVIACAFSVGTVYNRLIKAVTDELTINPEDMEEEEEEED